MNPDIENCEFRRKIALHPRYILPAHLCADGCEHTHSSHECCTHPNGPTTKFGTVENDPYICDKAVESGLCPRGYK